MKNYKLRKSPELNSGTNYELQNTNYVLLFNYSIFLLFFILPFTFLSLNSNAQNNNPEKVNYTDSKGLKQGKWEKVYPNGKLAYRACFVDNNPVGKMERFHENGKPMATIEYDEKGVNGHGFLYDENGQKAAEGNYKGTNKDGEWLFFDASGRLISKEMYVNNKKYGKTESYYNNGIVSMIGFMKDDLKEGDEIFFYPSGNQRLGRLLQ